MPIRLVAFDLDGTLVRGPTSVMAIGHAIGRADECAEFEELSLRDIEAVTAARDRMAGWYRGHASEELARGLDDVPLAPGARDAFALLRRHGIKTAIVSVTWSFAVEWFGKRLGADYTYGTRLTERGIDHVWPEDKGRRLGDLGRSLALDPDEIAAVGDSGGDRELLAAAGVRFFVGRNTPDVPLVRHMPDANLLRIAEQIVGYR